MNNEILNVNIDSIIPNRFQPRLVFDEKALNELADSIKEHGIIEPIIVRELNDKFEIIAGERRYKAACIAGLTKVPVIVRNLSDYKSAQVAVIENVQRRNLNPVEEAKSYKRILDQGLKTQEELAKEIGVSQSTIANKLRLLTLSEPVKQALSENKISERHARALLKVESLDKQEELLNKVITNRLTVRDLDEEIKDLDTPKISFKLPEVPVINNNFNLFDEPKEEEPHVIEPKVEEVSNEDNSHETSVLDIFNELPKDHPSELELNEEEPTKEKNIFDIPTINVAPKIEYPSLDDLKTNMDLGVENDILVPEVPETEEVTPEQKIEVTEPIVVPEQEVPVLPKIVSNDLNSVKTAISDLNKEIREAGFNIEVEDYDFSDLYQVIIKINK